MNYSTVSSKAVIAKVYRDLKPKDSSWEVDALEWIGEALEFIGGFYGFELKEIHARVENFRALLPSGMFELIAVRKGNYRLRHEGHVQRTPRSMQDMVVKTAAGVSSYAFTDLPEESEEYYFLQPGYIKTSFESGTVRLQCLCFPTDDCGYPEIPDNIYVKQALWWYIVRQMLAGGYEHKVFNWETADYKWQRYCVAAGNSLMFPNPERMSAFKEKWVRLLPYINTEGLEGYQAMDSLDNNQYGAPETE